MFTHQNGQVEERRLFSNGAMVQGCCTSCTLTALTTRAHGVLLRLSCAEIATRHVTPTLACLFSPTLSLGAVTIQGYVVFSNTGIIVAVASSLVVLAFLLAYPLAISVRGCCCHQGARIGCVDLPVACNWLAGARRNSSSEAAPSC